MTRTEAINQFLTTFDQATMTTAEQILAVGAFYDLVSRTEFERGYRAGTKIMVQTQTLVDQILQPGSLKPKAAT